MLPRLLLASLLALTLSLALPGLPGAVRAQAQRPVQPVPAAQRERAAAPTPATVTAPAPALRSADTADDDFPDFTSDPATRHRKPRVHYRYEVRRNAYADGTLRTQWQVRIGPDGQEVREGPLVRYHANGKLALYGAYRDGHPSGVWRWFDRNGDLIRTAVPQPGYDEILSGRNLENPDTVYRDVHGRKLAQGVRKYGQPVGLWTYFHPDGSVSARGRFVAGLPDGRWVVYFPSGMVEREDHYRLGVPDGAVMRGWPTGSDRLQGHMSQGLRVGHWRTWYGNGQLESEGDYREDRRQGDWRFWDEHGKLLRHVRYAEGRIVAELPLPQARVGPPPVIPEPELLPFRPRVYDRSGKEIHLRSGGEVILGPHHPPSDDDPR